MNPQDMQQQLQGVTPEMIDALARIKLMGQSRKKRVPGPGGMGAPVPSGGGSQEYNSIREMLGRLSGGG